MATFNKIRHPKKRAMLAAYAETGNITQSVRIAEIDRSLHYVWIDKDQKYQEAFEQAKDMAAEALEAEARRRAVHGVDKPVFYKGKKVGSVKEYSDTLLIFLAKGAMPDKYRERTAVEHTGSVGVQVVFDPGMLSPPDKDA